jgi:hypothetical protein
MFWIRQFVIMLYIIDVNNTRRINSLVDSDTRA